MLFKFGHEHMKCISFSRLQLRNILNLSVNFSLVYRPDSISMGKIPTLDRLTKDYLPFDRFDVTHGSADILCLKKGYNHNFSLDGILALHSKFIKSYINLITIVKMISKTDAP